MKRKTIAGIATAFLAAAVMAAAVCGCGSRNETAGTKAVVETKTTAAESASDSAGDTAAENASYSSSGAAGEESAEASGNAVSGMLSGIHHAEITVKDYGTIKVELDADTAPITVSNFCFLANKGFYDGLTFHRIIDGFMIQGGDPNGNGSGGSGFNIKGEFASNGVENDISHVKGVISMARASDPDSASSQFFIMVGDGTYLDGDYAAFGRVTEGQEIADKIAGDAKPTDNNGSIRREEQPVIESVKIID